MYLLIKREIDFELPYPPPHSPLHICFTYICYKWDEKGQGRTTFVMHIIPSSIVQVLPHPQNVSLISESFHPPIRILFRLLKYSRRGL